MNLPTVIEIQNKFKDFFSGLTFIEETHKYFIDGEPVKISVSGKYGKYGEKFNAEQKAISVANRTGQSVEPVLKEWKAAGDKAIAIGNAAHKFGEVYPFNRKML